MATCGSGRRLEAPDGLVASRFDLADDAFVLFEWPAQSAPSPTPDLTPAEREILEQVLAGRSNAEIGRCRGRSPRTVANQITSLFRRLGVASRFELFALAARPRPGSDRGG